MSLRCLLFSSDEGTAHPIRQVLADLDIEGEYCPMAAGTAQKVSSQPFHLVIVDWDDQPDAGVLLQAARERKAAERPLTLAIVKDDSSVSQALQAGANSILRRPILPDQVRDTLTKARDLLKAKLEPPSPLPQAAPVATASGAVAQTASAPPEIKQPFGSEILPRASMASKQFDTESEVPESLNQGDHIRGDSLKDLEPVGRLEEGSPAAEPRSDEPRGLSWYLKGRAGAPQHAAATSESPAPPASQPELLAYSNMPVSSGTSRARIATLASGAETLPEQRARHEQKTEAELFAYMSGEAAERPKPASAMPHPRLRKAALIGALILTGGAAYVTVPRALWAQNLQLVLASVANLSHGWLNPQPVTPVPAPVSHENFGRAGDEYKLPVAENIPDATTDPSQIRVLPAFDPTAKQPNGAANGGQVPTLQNPGTPTPGESSSMGLGGGDQSQPPTSTGAQENQPSPSVPATSEPAGKQPEGTITQPTSSTSPAVSARPDPFAAPASKSPALVIVPTTPSSAQSSPPNNPPPARTSAPSARGIPSSLRSQLASTTPDSSGNKPAEAAMPSIEPVELPESAARALLLDQPEPAYPANAKGRQGKVTLQVLIGRDGTVQDAKFLQGSLVFAHVAVDAVKQWRFKPYIMNSRAVTVQTLVTMTFKPAP